MFGLPLSVASTVVLLRALQTQGILASEAGRIAVGWLIVEDFITVLVLGLLPGFTSALELASARARSYARKRSHGQHPDYGGHNAGESGWFAALMLSLANGCSSGC